MDPRDFHALAVELARSGSPAKRRTAISRGYYSAFHVGIETLLALGFRIGRGAAGHGEVVRCFANSGDNETRDAASLLSDLHGARIQADYQLQRIDIEQASNSQSATDDSQALIAAFDAILTSPRRPQIQAAIAAWRKSNGYP